MSAGGLQVVVVGGGMVGAALARALHARGDRVAVLSPEPVALPAMWMRCDAVTGEGLRRGVRGAEVVVFAAGTQDAGAAAELARMGAQHTASAAAHAGARRLVLLAPIGATAHAQAPALRAAHEGIQASQRLFEGASALRLPWLFGEGDALLEPWLERARRGRRLRAPGIAHPLRPLWVGDAVKVLLRLVDGSLGPGSLGVQGPEALTFGALAEQVRQRLGVGEGWRSCPPARALDLALLPEQQGPEDDWPGLGLGERLTVGAWLERWSRHRFG